MNLVLEKRNEFAIPLTINCFTTKMAKAENKN